MPNIFLISDSIDTNADTYYCFNNNYIKSISIYNNNAFDVFLTLKFYINYGDYNNLKLLNSELNYDTNLDLYFWKYTCVILGNGFVTIFISSNNININTKGSLYTYSTNDEIIIQNKNNEDVISSNKCLNFIVEANNYNYFHNIYYLLSKNGNGDYNIKSNYENTIDNNSFGLMRTNPKLTGNVKITVDSSGSLWMNSIDSDIYLSDQSFKNVKISHLSSFETDIKHFFQNGNTPNEIVFKLDKSIDDYKHIKKNLYQQYERLYTYGCSYSYGNLSGDDISIFAPLFLKRNIPNYFIIFKTEGPVNDITYTTNYNNETIINDILKQSYIVKVFDLSEKSQIGQYLRNINSRKYFDEVGINVSFEKEGYTSYNGLSYKDGFAISKKEFLFDYFSESHTITEFDEFITQGFERNGIICDNIINLEFLFTDDTSENYELNRYFGLYANTIDIFEMKSDLIALNRLSQSINQNPIPSQKIISKNNIFKKYDIKNDNGICLYFDTLPLNNYYSYLDFTSHVDSITLINSLNNLYELKILGNYTDKINIGDDCILYNDDIQYGDNGTIENVNYDRIHTTLNISFNNIPNILNTNLYFFSEEKYEKYKTKFFEDDIIGSDYNRQFCLNDKYGNLYTIKNSSIKNIDVDTFNTRKTIELKLKNKKFDLSSISGINDLKYKIDSKLISKSGSSLQMTLLKNFKNGDYIEISDGNVSLDIPHRWKLIANESYLSSANSIFLTYSIDSDSDGLYYYTYFYPNDISLSELAKNICDAFKLFEYKSFYVFNKNENIYFISNSKGLDSESYYLKYKTTDTNTISIMNTEVNNTGKIYFIGASDYNNNKFRIAISDISKIDEDDLILTTDGFSKIKQYDISGKKILYSLYIDEIEYLDNEIKDIKNIDTYYTVSLADNTSQCYITNDNRISVYNRFYPNLSLLSFANLKDFDTDVFISDYNKSYDNELIKYYENNYGLINIISADDNTNIITINTTIDIENSNIHFIIINDDGPIYNKEWTLSKIVGYNNMFLCNGFIPSDILNKNIIILSEDQLLFYNDNDLFNFNGFFNLSNFVSENTENEFEQLKYQWNIDRFNTSKLNSEYDLLLEQYIPALSLKSKVEPYIVKWVKDGNNVRDVDYRLNNSMSFGIMNFSPIEYFNEVNPNSHTHEWYYLEKVPQCIDSNNDNINSYCICEMNDIIDFTSTDIDFFSLYFSSGYPTEYYKEEKLNLLSNKKYSIFKYDSNIDKLYTFFKGKYLTIDNKKYENYKFSILITTSNDTNDNSNPVTYETIINERWKFILIKINVSLYSYKYPNGNFSYLDLYTCDNVNQKISKFLNNNINLSLSPIDIKLSQPLNFEYYAWNPNNTQSFRLCNKNGITKLQMEIHQNKDGIYNRLTAISNYNTQSFITLPVINSIDSLYQHVTFENNLSYIKFQNINVSMPFYLPNFDFWNNSNMFYENGGLDYGEYIKYKLSFEHLSHIITDGNREMKYIIKQLDNTISNNKDFNIKIVLQDEVNKINELIPQNISNKPSILYEYDNIGYETKKVSSKNTIFRYGGNYIPKFKNILIFNLRENDDFTILTKKDYLLFNTYLNTSNNNSIYLKNQYYNKVSNEEILITANTYGVDSIYPLIDEIAIDKKDINIWNSSFDNNYYNLYYTKSKYDQLNGLNNLKEIKSFMGSKCMNLENIINLYEFNIKQYDDISEYDSSNDEIAYAISNDKIEIIVNFKNRLIRNLSGNDNIEKVNKSFKYLADKGIINPDDISTMTKKYIIDNIIDLYKIDKIEFYTKNVQNSNNIFDIINDKTLSEKNIHDKKYVLKKDFKKDYIDNMTIKIQLDIFEYKNIQMAIGILYKK